MIKALILACSHRRQSNSARIGAHIADSLSSKGVAAGLFDHGETPLPLWTPALAESDGGSESLARLRALAEDADALVCAVPEYSGMAAPAFKNFILMMSDQHLGHKPALLVGVSAGKGGAYPIAELRMSSYKNTRLLWIPENVIVRQADDFPDEGDEETSQRLEYALSLLIDYAKALADLRRSSLVANKPYPFGV